MKEQMEVYVVAQSVNQTTQHNHEYQKFKNQHMGYTRTFECNITTTDNS